MEDGAAVEAFAVKTQTTSLPRHHPQWKRLSFSRRFRPCQALDLAIYINL